MRFATVAVMALGSLGSVARADVTADVTSDYTSFVTDVVAGKKPAVDLMISPTGDSGSGLDDNWKLEVPAPKLSNITVVTAKSGTAAWIVADLAGMVPGKAKPVAGTIRTSAFLVHDAKGWHVKAAHWSVGVADEKGGPCGEVRPWQVATTDDPMVETINRALGKKFDKLFSTDNRAIMIGSGPNERWTGAAIPKVFAHFTLTSDGVSHPMLGATGQGPDLDLAWVVMPVMAPIELCTEYRALFVLQRESKGWKIVHQHYSQPVTY